MKVLHINKQDTGGGAAIAALRIHRALRANGIDSSLLALTRQSDDEHTFAVGNGLIHNIKTNYHFIAERVMQTVAKDLFHPSGT